MNHDALSYLNELAADIVANGGLSEGQTIEEAMNLAHDRRRSFALEMAVGETDRAKKVRRVLAAKVYGDILVNQTIESLTDENDMSYRMTSVDSLRRDIETGEGA